MCCHERITALCAVIHAGHAWLASAYESNRWSADLNTYASTLCKQSPSELGAGRPGALA
jgi:hypothetical protein